MNNKTRNGKNIGLIIKNYLMNMIIIMNADSASRKWRWQIYQKNSKKQKKANGIIQIGAPKKYLKKLAKLGMKIIQ